jgi:hypothetical protein
LLNLVDEIHISYFIFHNKQILSTQGYVLNVYVLVYLQLGLLYPMVAIIWLYFLINKYFQLLNALQVFCSMVHQKFMRYNNFRYCKFFCRYSTKFNDIKFSRYFKLCFFILPLNFLLDDFMQCFSFAHLFLWSSNSSNMMATRFIYCHEC